MPFPLRWAFALCAFFIDFFGTRSPLSAQETNPAVRTPQPAAPGLHLVSAPVTELDLANYFEVPGVLGAVAQFVTTSGTLNVELLPDAAPNHVDNFRAYVAIQAYDNTLFHRVAEFEAGQGPSILQGGGFSATLPVSTVTARSAVNLEYGLPNARGTLAAARTSDPNSAMSQWYFNTRDNSTILGPANDGHGYTVFGRVLGTGMDVVDALADHPVYNAGGVFSALPLRDILPGQTQITAPNFLAVQSVRMIPVYPESAAETALLRFSVESATTNVVTAEVVDGRTLRITAHQPGLAEIVVNATDTNGNRAISTLSFEVGGRRQTVSFFGIWFNPVQWHPGNITKTLQATSSAGLPVHFTVVSGPGTIAGNVLTFTGIGTVMIAARQPGDENTTPAEPAYLSLTMEKGSQSADFGDLPSNMRVNAPPFKAIATATSGLPVTLSVSGPATLGEDGETITLTGEEGVVRITPTQAGNEFYEPLNPEGYEDHLIFVSRVPQVMNFPAIAGRPVDPTLSPIPLAALSDSGLPVSYTVDSGPAVLTEDGRALIVTGAGTVTVSARQAGSEVFAPAVTTIQFSTTKLPQQIHFPEIPDRVFQSKRPDNNSLALEAEASSGLPVEFSLVSGAGILNDATLAITRQDRFTVRARQPGDAFYEPAEQVQREFVARSDARIVFDAWYENGDGTRVGNIPAIIAPGNHRPFIVSAGANGAPSWGIELELLSDETAYLSSPYDLSGGGSSRIAIGTPQYNPARVTPTGGPGAITLRAFRTSEPDLFLEPAATFTVHVGRTQTIRFDQPKPVPLAQGFVTVRPTASSGLPVTLEVVSGPATVSLNPDGSHRLDATDSGLLVLRASQAGEGVFAPATPVEREWLVLGQEQTLAFELPATSTYGDAPIPLAASSNLSSPAKSLPVAFSVVSGPGMIDAESAKLRFLGAGAIVVRAGQVGGGGIGPAFAFRTVQVRKATHVRGVSTRRFVGAASFDLALAYSGFVGDDDASRLETPPRARTPATKASPPGDYPITFVGGADDSYEFVAGAPAGILTLHSFGGAYEALIKTESGALLGKVALTLSTKSATYSGTLTLAETGGVMTLKPASSTALTPTTEDYKAASGLAVAKISSPSVGTLYHRIEFTVAEDGVFAGALKKDRVDGGMGSLVIVTDTKGNFAGRRLYAGKAAPWEGAYTEIFANRTATDYAQFPLGAGWAVASVTKAGRLALTGRLSDDSVLTTSVTSDELGGFRLFHNPYGQRPDSYLGGSLTFAPIDSPARKGRYHVAPDNEPLAWRKAPRPTAAGSQAQDALFPAGFGPMPLSVVLDPWTPPVSTGLAGGRISLAQRLNLANDTTSAAWLEVSLGDGDFGASSADLPAAIQLLSANRFAPPAPNPSAWSLRVVEAKTGRFAGSFTLQDEIPAPTAANPSATKIVKRPVSFTGILRQPVTETDEATPMLGAGYLILKPLPATPPDSGLNPTTLKPESHELRLSPMR